MKIALYIFGVVSLTFSYSQDGGFNLGARSSGIGGASVTLSDPYSLFNNVAGLGGITQHYVFAGYQNRFGISELQVLGAGVLYHTDIGTAGVGFYKFGDDLFSKQRLHLAVGSKIQLVSLGLSADLIQYDIATVGTKRAMALTFGGIAEITPELSFGAHIFNINQANLVKETGEKVPTVMKAGMSFHPIEELFINAEIEKDLGFDEVIKIGLEYQIVKRVFLRTGISSQPSRTNFGIGFHPDKLLFDYAYTSDSNLGSIHELSLAYSIKR